MTAAWSVRALLQDLAARGRHPAVIAYADDRPVVWDSATLVMHACKWASRLRRAGLAQGGRAMLWAPNSPAWIAAAVAVLACGAVLVALDDLADAEELGRALASSTPDHILTTLAHRRATADILGRYPAEVLLIDAPAPAGAETAMDVQAWAAALPNLSADAAALLCWTSGTTGAPKAFLLSHGNVAANLAALRQLALIGPEDRALLPLPLHHAYPFVVGMLTPLTLGTAIVLPPGSTGPALARALREQAVTAIVGVPRLYEAVLETLEARAAGHGAALRLLWRAGLLLAQATRRAGPLRLGPWLFAPLRRRIAPCLRLLVSGGARLQRETEERLEALGWTVLSGYGLAETASLFTGNRPDARRLGSAGRPLAGGEIRIASADEEGVGEIELRGASITGGYIDNPEADRAAFTPDGWFRTGDLGFVDRDGFLFVTGRAKEVLVLGGGKKVNPEDLERAYGAAPEIVELAVLEDSGALAALVRPDAAKLRLRGATNVRDGVRIVLGEIAQGLPSYQRLSGFAVTDQPLPRTRLGKYRRFLLPRLYAEAAAGGLRRAAHPLGPEDAALLGDPTAAAVWRLLRQRYPAGAIDLDVNLGLDLNLDSFGWMELTLLLHDELGVRLSEADIAEIVTIRDLLRRAVERRAGAGAAEVPAAVATDLDRWLAPHGVWLGMLAICLYGFNRLAMRALFRLRAAGLDHLPGSGAFVLTPNHLSYLDGPAIAAALPFRRCVRLYWAGDRRLLFSRRLTRLFSRALHIFPVDADHPGAAVEAARQVLHIGGIPVWFPEGWRSPDGRLQRFQPGIGELLLHSPAPVVPVYVRGAFEALPRTRRMPRLARISVTFGRPVQPADLAAAGTGRNDEQRIADALHDAVAALARDAGERSVLSGPDPSEAANRRC